MGLLESTSSGACTHGRGGFAGSLGSKVLGGLLVGSSALSSGLLCSSHFNLFNSHNGLAVILKSISGF